MRAARHLGVAVALAAGLGLGACGGNTGKGAAIGAAGGYIYDRVKDKDDDD